MIAYANDVALLVEGRFIDILFDLTQGYLNLTRWAASCGLAVNPGKTGLVLFTRKYKIPGVALPSIGGIRVQLSEKIKYLGLILDGKLSWKPNIEKRARKASVAFYCCRGAIGKRWGLSPKVFYWLYETIVKLILFYEAIVWWN